MPNYGAAAIVQSWLTRWEHAQQARYAAWTGAPTVVAGVTAVAGTAGSMLKGSGVGANAFSSVARWAAGPASGISFR